MTAADLDVEILRRTELGNGATVITARRGKPGLTRPFVTFVRLSSSRYAERLIDFATLAAAEHYHNHVAETFNNGGENDGTD